MEGRCFIESICPSGLLSFPPSNEGFGLKPLNVIIGPNASGKSNLIDIVSLVPALATDLSIPFGSRGSIHDWYWAGAESRNQGGLTLVANANSRCLGYAVTLSDRNHRPFVNGETVFEVNRTKDSVESRPLIQSSMGELSSIVAEVGHYDSDLEKDYRDSRQFDWSKSLLSQIRNTKLFPTIVAMTQAFQRIRVYAEKSFGRFSKSRIPQPADMPSDSLMEDGSNLALVINEMRHGDNTTWTRLLAEAKKFNPSLRDVSTRVLGGSVQLFVHEEGLRNPIPATRISDGTFQYLSLLVILCHPNPPSLVCLEEPELGLHPDMLKTVAELLIDASKRMQLIVTTHSDVLVSALSDVPEAIVVCEKDDSGTKLRRLEPDKLKHWLDKYTLGEIWSMGEIGGNRW